MCSPLTCGTSNFPAEEYDTEELLSPCKSPKTPSKKIKDSKNPYTNRGLDKFNALLAELESKKQQIYTRKGSEDISFIRFEYSSSSGKWKPIVVKTKGKIRSDDQYRRSNVDKNNIVKNGNDQVVQESKVGEIMSKNPQIKSKRLLFKMDNLSQPMMFIFIFIFILLLLTISGRTFAILCASFGWYLVPLIKDKSMSSSSSSSLSSSLSSSSSMDSWSSKKNEVYSGKLSERNIHHVTKLGSASPNSVLSGPEDKSPVKHAHRKSW